MRVLNLVTSSDAEFFEQQVAGLQRHGVQSTTLAVPGERRPSHDGTRSRSVLHYARFFPKAYRYSFREYDLVHANYGLTAPPAVLQPNLPVIITLWGTDLLGRYGWLSRACASRADAVVVMSDEMADRLDGRCTVLPHGVDLDRFRPQSRSAARATVGWDRDVHHVLFPYSTRRAVKDYPRAARVVARAREALDRPVRLHTNPTVAHDRMPIYMNAADVLLLTSRREGSPNTVKEALACNLPVVATDVGDVAAWLSPVDRSFVCRSDRELIDAVVSVLRFGGRVDGRGVVRQVSHARTTERLYELYRTVVDRRPPVDDAEDVARQRRDARSTA